MFKPKDEKTRRDERVECSTRAAEAIKKERRGGKKNARVDLS